MRLIGALENEKDVYAFCSFLQREGVQNTYEAFSEPKGKRVFQIWVLDEDDFPRAIELLEEYQQNRDDPKFRTVIQTIPHTFETKPEYDEVRLKAKVNLRLKAKPFAFALTNFFLILCIVLFFWNDAQEVGVVKEKGMLAVEVGLTPLQQKLLFDIPQPMQELEQFLTQHPLKSLDDVKTLPPEVQAQFHQIENAPQWHGIYQRIIAAHKGEEIPIEQEDLFGKIRQGEYWRLFTPALLHANFLHILFNMAWLWILGRQIEARLKKWKLLLFILIVGIIANVAQYIMSGPYFLGFSAIIVGMAGFIWMRQKVSPWEGYPLQRATLLFILFFVLAMFVLEILSFSVQYFTSSTLMPTIANTAHIVGGLCGVACGRLSFFARGPK